MTACNEFQRYSGFGAALQASAGAIRCRNVLRVHPTADAQSGRGDLEALERYFAAWPEVDVVQMDAEWVLRFNAMLALMQHLLLLAAALLGVGVLAIVGNTIRLEIQGRRDEIEVTKLVGGSNGFVRRPFLYTGMLYGVLGGARGLADRRAVGRLTAGSRRPSWASSMAATLP